MIVRKIWLSMDSIRHNLTLDVILLKLILAMLVEHKIADKTVCKFVQIKAIILSDR